MAPKVTLAQIESRISGEYSTTLDKAVGGASVPQFPDLKRVTLCVLVLENGYVVTGESSCVDMANFDAVKGRQLAREDAIGKIWALEGYVLRNKLAGV